MEHFADSHIHLTLTSEEKTLFLLNQMASLGVTDCTVHALPYRGEAYNLRLLDIKNRYDKINLRVFGALHDFGQFEGIDPLKQAKTLLALGCDGMKFMEQDPLLRKVKGFGLNDPYYAPLFEYLQENDIPCTFHVADPEEFWEPREMSEEEKKRGWFYGDGTFPTKETILREALEVVEKFPRLRVTFAHFFFQSNHLEFAREVMETYPNVLFDLTPGWEMYLGFSKRISDWHDFFMEHQTRILFGTDSNNYKSDNDKLHLLVKTALTHDESEFPMPAFAHPLIRGLNLPEEAVRNIVWNNYVMFVGERPKKVNTELLQKEAERMLSAMEANLDYKPSVRWLNDDYNNKESVNWLKNYLGK